MAAGEYLPRLLYPGTYGNFCGPTPEFPGGWRGNEPIDAVDGACQAHDAAYDACKIGLRGRSGSQATPSTLSVLTALRSTGLSAPVLSSIGSDEEYLNCVHAADQGLIRDGLRIRAASQRRACPGGYDYPKWFCQLQSLTLSRIERVDFDLFLADLDWDDARRSSPADQSGSTQLALSALEKQRRAVLNSGRATVPELAESVRDIEAEMNARLGNAAEGRL